MSKPARDEIQQLRAAAEGDDFEACVELADLLSRSGDEAMKSEALLWYERAANLGDVLSMATLGGLLKQGWGTPVNLEAATAWFAKAAAGFEQASKADDEFTGAAMCSLAELLLAGDGGARDPERAVALYEQAAARGFHWALIHLGEAYEQGKGVPNDLQRARQTFERAIAAGADSYARDCLQRVEEAIHQTETTEPVEAKQAEASDAVAAFAMAFQSDSAEDAARWRRRAAGMGHITALQMMGDFWLESDEGAADPGYGYAWLALATRERHGKPAATASRLRAQVQERANDVWKELTPEQRARATDLLARCDSGPPYKLPDEL